MQHWIPMRALSLLLSAGVLAAVVAIGCADSTENTPAGSGSGSNQTGTGGKPKAPETGQPDQEQPAAPVTCNGAPGELYALSATRLAESSELALCTLKGHAVLIVNGASGCGYTPQYAPLQALYAKYKSTQKLPFEILAFPSKSFNQEKDSDADVSKFCTDEYKIKFPLFTIAPVKDDAAKGETAQPVYQWLREQPDMSTPVAWNFEKFLIGKDGKVVKRWLSAVSPDEGGEIDLAIAAELAK
jgi:glutathione peroxidase-family protein